jgi:uncharacterized surface protein with fasciclin (FAS1) repeats
MRKMILGTALAVAVSTPVGAQTMQGTIVDVAASAGHFSTLLAAVKAAGLEATLRGPGPFTVFAPTDAAFAALPDGTVEALLMDKAGLTSILTYHVVSGRVMAADVVKLTEAITVNGEKVAVVVGRDGVTVNGAKVVQTDIAASNGVIHVIDRIILPPEDDIVETAVAAGSFTTLATALTEAGLVDELQGAGPFTVFAPTDAAFAKLAALPSGDALRDVLLYHVVSGAVGSGDLVAGNVPTLLSGESLTVSLTGGVSINDASVTQANIVTKNGVIHVIDAVLVPE